MNAYTSTSLASSCVACHSVFSKLCSGIKSVCCRARPLDTLDLLRCSVPYGEMCLCYYHVAQSMYTEILPVYLRVAWNQSVGNRLLKVSPACLGLLCWASYECKAAHVLNAGGCRTDSQRA